MLKCCFKFEQNLEHGLFIKKEKAEKKYVSKKRHLNYIKKQQKMGEGVEKDEIKAFEYFKKLAEKDDAEAQFKLGYCYYKGIGIEINKEKSVELYKIAAENGNEVAQYNLGICYQNGEGVEKDEIKAFEYYKKSAEKKYISAIFQLGYC